MQDAVMGEEASSSGVKHNRQSARREAQRRDELVERCDSQESCDLVEPSPPADGARMCKTLSWVKKHHPLELNKKEIRIEVAQRYEEGTDIQTATSGMS